MTLPAVNTTPLGLLGNALLLGPTGLAAALTELGRNSFIPHTETKEALWMAGFMSRGFQNAGLWAQGALDPLLKRSENIRSEGEAKTVLGELGVFLMAIPEAIYREVADATAIHLGAVTYLLTTEHQRGIAERILERTLHGNFDLADEEGETPHHPSSEEYFFPVRAQLRAGKMARAYRRLQAVLPIGLIGIQAKILLFKLALHLGRNEEAKKFQMEAAEIISAMPLQFNWNHFQRDPALLYSEDATLLFDYIETMVNRERGLDHPQCIVNLLGKYNRLTPQLLAEKGIAMKAQRSNLAEAEQMFDAAIREFARHPSTEVLIPDYVDRFQKAGDTREIYKLRTEEEKTTFRTALLKETMEMLQFRTVRITKPMALLHRLLEIPVFHTLLHHYSLEEITAAINSVALERESLSKSVVLANIQLSDTPTQTPRPPLPPHPLVGFGTDWDQAIREGNRFSYFYRGTEGTFLSDPWGRRGILKSRPYGDEASKGKPLIQFLSEETPTQIWDSLTLDIPPVDDMLAEALNFEPLLPVEAKERLETLKETLAEKFRRDILQRPELERADPETQKRLLEVLQNPLYTRQIVFPLEDDLSKPTRRSPLDTQMAHFNWTGWDKSMNMVSRAGSPEVSFRSPDRSRRLYYIPRENILSLPSKAYRAIRKDNDPVLKNYFQRVELYQNTAGGEFKFIKDFDRKTLTVVMVKNVAGFVLPFQSERFPLAIRMHSELKGTVLGQIVQYHEAIHILDLTILERAQTKLTRRNMRRRRSEMEFYAYRDQAQMLKEIDWKATDLALMEAEVIANGMNELHAKRLISRLFDVLWVDSAEAYVENALENGAVPEF